MKIILLHWLWGWASLIEGLVAIFTLGVVRLDLSLHVSIKVLRIWVKEYKKGRKL